MCSQILNLHRGREMKTVSSGSTSRVIMSLCSLIENESNTHTSSTISHNDAVRDSSEDIDMYKHMWRACAGTLIYIPRPGESVVYFLQGHIEQVEPYINRDTEMEMPIYDLPSKILCKVLDVQLKVEIQTDEVYAQITLLPESKQHEASSNIEDMSSARAPRNKPHVYSKTLTLSDTSMHGGFSLPKRLADEYLPPLDMSQQTPSQDIAVKDLQGVDWQFHHIYRGNPRRHLLTTRWSAFVTSKKLVAGDVCLFLRESNGDLRIGIHRSAKSRTTSSPSVISNHTMQHGILANVFHAITSGTMFTVYYRPWTCPSGFIVSLNQYMESTMNEYSVGRKFKMQFEDDAGREQKFGGTIAGVEDVDRIRWPGSKWRCIKVKWDSYPNEHSLPERISPWDVELAIPNKQKQSFPLTPPKRICLESSSRKLPPVIANGGQRAIIEELPMPKEGIFQRQEATPNLFRDPDAAYLQISKAKPVSHGPSARSPGRQSQMKGTNDRTGPSLRVSHMNQECREGEAPRAADDNDATPSCRKEIKVFGFKLVETTCELPSQQAADRSE